MEDTSIFSLTFLLAGLRVSVPYVLASLGGTLSERVGVIALALEGFLVAGALGAALCSALGGLLVGLGGGALAGLVVAALYGVIVLRFRANQILAGLAINIIMAGLSRYLLKLVWKSAASSPSVPGFDERWQVAIFMVVAATLVYAVHVMYRRTRVGLRMTAVGERPDAADALGVDVVRLRWIAVLGGGLLAGLGGAWLAMDVHGFSAGMVGARGYIALAAVILGGWRPVPAAVACLLFGFVDAWTYGQQHEGGLLPREILQILPYLLTLIALAGGFGRSRAPGALGRPWWGR
jgi:ABC-type uncharacterized transport system permease subunit